jgi:hypothetical protein
MGRLKKKVGLCGSPEEKKVGLCGSPEEKKVGMRRKVSSHAGKNLSRVEKGFSTLRFT